MEISDWLIEKHISEWSLPNENIISWIKWDSTKIDFDQIIIKSEADLLFTRILNVDEKAWSDNDMKKGKITIKKELLQIDNFVGFVCEYTAIPEDERHLSFEIDFIKNENKSESVSLETVIVRPMVIIENISEQGIVVTENNPFVPPLTFELKGKGRARVLNLTPFLDQHFEGKEVSITITNTVEQDNNTDPLFVVSSKRIIPKISITGKGFGMLTMGYEYEDAIGNKYRTKVVDIPIELRQQRSLEIPLSQELSDQKTLLLLEPKIN